MRERETVEYIIRGLRYDSDMSEFTRQMKVVDIGLELLLDIRDQLDTLISKK
jgi:hypothetical protein